MAENNVIKDVTDRLKENEGKVQSFINDVQKQEAEIKKITSIEEGMKKANEEYEIKRLESFKSSKGLSVDEQIGEDLQEEYDKYELPKEERLTLCRRAAEPLYDVYFGRNRMLNALLGDKEKIKEAQENNETPELGKIAEDTQLLNDEIKEREKRINDIKEEIDKLKAEGYAEEIDPENPDAEREFLKQTEIDELETEISGINDEITEIKGYLTRIESLKQSAINAMGLQKAVRENIENSLKGAYGEDVAQVVIDEQKKKEEQEKGVEEKSNSQPQQIDPQTLAAAQQALKNTQAQAVQNPSVEETAKEDVKPDYLGMLGYNAGNVLNTKSSMALLDKYVGQEITDDQRLAMLNDPETRDIILSAMEKADKTLNPLNRIKFNKTRARLVHLAKNELVIKAIESLGEKNPKDIEQSFKKAQEEYNTIKNQIDEKMKSNISEEEKAELQNELDELNKKYESINNVEKFREATIPLEKFRNRVADKIASMLGKNDTLALPKETAEVKEVNIDQQDDFKKNLEQQSNTPEKAEQNQAEREENNKEVKAKDVQDIVK